MNKNKQSVMFISWAPYCSRSDNIAREFGGQSYIVYYSWFGSSFFTVAFKYLFQTLKSLRIICRNKPDVIFIMNPPIFSCIPALIYCKMYKNRGYVIDSHSAAFTHKKWMALGRIQKYFFSRSISNVVTNREHATIVKEWGGDYTIIGDIPVEYKKMERFPGMKDGFNVTIANSFSPKEPIELVLKAAEQIKGVNFYVTGNLKHADRIVVSKAPENVTFTGFVPDTQYAWLLSNSNSVMTQTLSDNTMQRGAYEAMAVETPIITSDWRILRETFYKGAVFVKNDVESITHGILEMKNNHERYKMEIKELKQERLVIWERNKALLISKIERHLEALDKRKTGRGKQ